ncbi:choice-of-anchor J domain-containing protein [Tahibacter harae]|uniref:choice-of-anchor J domain-containing protein n=1 Tax=Tahibacter harae TaxID=2963937 RepID=UPI00210CA212|nr:choice-of-anchor J domain-containing protein [Tahibacter harae]
MSYLLRRHALATAVALAFSSSSMAATLFLEDFQTRIDPDTQQPVLRCSGTGGAGTYPFPSGWLLRNVDNRTPASAVAYVNEAWEVREDFQLDVTNCVAFATSWYSPAGTANDWMWTPAIGPLPPGSLLSWRARNYDPDYLDGYEVRVMTAPTVPTGGTGVIGNQITNSTVVYSNAAEATAWASRSVDLAPYANQTIYVGFRLTSTDKFLLVVDDIAVTTSTVDLAAVAATPPFAVEYPRVPAGISVDANYKVTVRNVGGTPLTNVAATAQPTLDSAPSGAPLTAASIPTFAGNATQTIAFTPPVVLSTPGTWGVTYTATSDQNAQDADPGNNVVATAVTTIGDNVWSRHEGAVSGTLGIGAGNGGELGTSYTLTQTATFEGIRFAMGSVTDPAPPDPPNPWPGQNVVANLRATDANGKPAAVIATTQAIVSTYIGGIYDVKFVGGPQTLAPGTYFVSVVEPTGGGAMPLQLSLGRYVDTANWVNWPTIPGGDWANLSTFGASFQRVPHVSLLSEVSLFKDDFEQHADVPAFRTSRSAPSPTMRNPGERAALAVPPKR